MTASVNPNRVLLWALLILCALWFLLPLFVMVSTSLKDLDEIRQGGLMSPPVSPTLAAWVKAWAYACTGMRCDGMAPYFLNSVLKVVPSVIISTSLGAITGYVLTKWRFPGSELIFAFMLFGIFMPMQVVLLPMSQVLGWLGLAGSIPGMTLVHILAGMPATTLFFRNYYVSIPDELIRAAKIDGASFWQIFTRIILPISGPIIVVVVIWQFTHIWNDFLVGVAFSNTDTKPITVALNNMVNSSDTVKEYNVDMAAALIAALPTLIVYVIAGKYFLRGLTEGAVKG